MTETEKQTPAPPSSTASLPQNIFPGPAIFFGPNGLRAGWCALLFLSLFLLALFFLSASIGLLAKHLYLRLRLLPGTEINPAAGFLSEGTLLAATLLATFVMARIEGRSLFAYGLAAPQPTRPISAYPSRLRHFLIGLLSGFGFMSLLVGILVATHQLQLDAPSLPHAAIYKFAALWGAVFLLVAFAEELLLRGYLLFSLSRGLHFWLAAFFLAALFGALHKSNPGESPFGLVAASGAALLFSLSLWRIGSLWWAIGFHATWDWAESFFYGTPDSGILSHGRYMTAHSIGRVWLSGGTTGPEGSLWCLLVLALAAGFVLLTQKKNTTYF